ncbi:MAG TPA: hypothetical protein VGU69_10530 [Rhizomicrobium sp.]|nr:hypothetical protein [Rhizomicrobium sp.]
MEFLVTMPERSPDEMKAAEAMADFTLKVATPVVWHDRKQGWPKPIKGGTCFFLRFEDGVIGVTANHVVEALEAAISSNSNTVCQIRTTKPVDLPGLIIDRCADLDIATFRASGELVAEAEATVLDCRCDAWPPPKPDVGRAVTFCGFPETERVSIAPGVGNLFAAGSLGAIDAITDRNLIVTYDPERDQAAPWSPWKQPLGYNMSGCSGGPVLSHGTRRGIQRWFPIAMIIQGPRGAGTGDAAGWDMITMRRIDAIQPNGTIKREETGWLPR